MNARDYLRDIISALSVSAILNRRPPAVKYAHTASSGGLWSLFRQGLHQQLGADKDMHISYNSQTLTPLIL